MLGNVVPYLVAACVTVALWAYAIARLGFLTRDDVRAWRTLASLRGYGPAHGNLERIAERSATLRRLRDELDLRRLLAMAHRDETEMGFLVRTAFFALVALAAVIVLDVGSRLGNGDFAVPLWTALVAALVVGLVRFVRLRDVARRRREHAGQTLGDMMMLVAIMTDGRGLQVDDAVRILARCATTPDLQALVDGGWRRLVSGQPRSTAELYDAIARAYRIEEFAAVAEALTTVNVGVGERDTYSRVAHSVYQRRLTDAKMQAARARILVTLPIAAMLVPLLLLLGAPTMQSITSGFGGG